MIEVKKIAEILLPKSGHSEEECEDAKCITQSFSKKTFKVAIADGATESSFSKEWANILVNAVTRFRIVNKKELLKNLTTLQKKWNGKIESKDLPWYAEIKLSQGAFSTLLGMQIRTTKGVISGFAIGDCCMYQIRSDELVLSFPININEEFNNHPFLLKSKPDNKTELLLNIRELKRQKIKKGDYLFFMSDALGDWFSAQTKLNQSPWNTLLELTQPESNISFENWLTKQRENRWIKNDDITLIILELN